MMRSVVFVLLMTACTQLSTPAQLVQKPVQLDSSDRACLAWVIDSEARGESLRGARAVLDVVLARSKNRKLTPCEVVAQRRQFSGYRPGVFNNISEEALTRYEVVRKMAPVAASCQYFHATYVSPPWITGMRRCTKVGNHIFYKPKRANPLRRKTTWKSPKLKLV